MRAMVLPRPAHKERETVCTMDQEPVEESLVTPAKSSAGDRIESFARDEGTGSGSGSGDRQQPGNNAEADADAGVATPAAKHARKSLYGTVTDLVGRAAGLFTPGRAHPPAECSPSPTGGDATPEVGVRDEAEQDQADNKKGDKIDGVDLVDEPDDHDDRTRGAAVTTMSNFGSPGEEAHISREPDKAPKTPPGYGRNTEKNEGEGNSAATPAKVTLDKSGDAEGGQTSSLKDEDAAEREKKLALRRRDREGRYSLSSKKATERPHPKFWTCSGCYTRNFNFSADVCYMCRLPKDFDTFPRNPHAIYMTSTKPTVTFQEPELDASAKAFTFSPSTMSSVASEAHAAAPSTKKGKSAGFFFRVNTFSTTTKAPTAAPAPSPTVKPAFSLPSSQFAFATPAQVATSATLSTSFFPVTSVSTAAPAVPAPPGSASAPAGRNKGASSSDHSVTSLAAPSPAAAAFHNSGGFIFNPTQHKRTSSPAINDFNQAIGPNKRGLSSSAQVAPINHFLAGPSPILPQAQNTASSHAAAATPSQSFTAQLNPNPMPAPAPAFVPAAGRTFNVGPPSRKMVRARRSKVRK